MKINNVVPKLLNCHYCNCYSISFSSVCPLKEIEVIIFATEPSKLPSRARRKCWVRLKQPVYTIKVQIKKQVRGMEQGPKTALHSVGSGMALKGPVASVTTWYNPPYSPHPKPTNVWQMCLIFPHSSLTEHALQFIYSIFVYGHIFSLNISAA